MAQLLVSFILTVFFLCIGIEIGETKGENRLVRFKIEHGCAYYDSAIGKLIDKEKCEDK